MKKDVRELVQQAQSIGWKDTGRTDSKGLHILEHESGAEYRLTANPNDYRTLPNNLRDLEKIAGRKVERSGKRRKSHKAPEVSGFNLEHAARDNQARRDQLEVDNGSPIAYSTATRKPSKPEPVEVFAEPVTVRNTRVTKVLPIKPKTDCWDGEMISARSTPYRVSINGEVYEMYFSDENTEKFDGFMQTLLGGADEHVSQMEILRAKREAKKREERAKKGPRAPEGMGLKIRTWLIEQGYEGVGDRGRFRQEWLDDYFKAHPKEARLARLA